MSWWQGKRFLIEKKKPSNKQQNKTRESRVRSRKLLNEVALLSWNVEVTQGCVMWQGWGSGGREKRGLGLIQEWVLDLLRGVDWIPAAVGRAED